MIVLISTMVGGLLAMYLLASLWEYVVFKRVANDPVTGKVSSVISAYVSGSTIAGFGMADGGPFYAGAYLLYLLPALVVGAFFYRRGLKLRESVSRDANLVDTFD